MRRVLLAVMVGGVAMAGSARADYAKGQELVILTAHSALLAARHCPYRLDDRRLGAFLSRKGLTRADLDSGRFSSLLQDDMAADDARYEHDTAAACDQAWASFGPGSPLSGILRAK